MARHLDTVNAPKRARDNFCRDDSQPHRMVDVLINSDVFLGFQTPLVDFWFSFF